MNPGGYTAEVTSLSSKATEEDVKNFFSFCGPIEHVEILRGDEYVSTAYVTFEESHSLRTAILLSGATILDQNVCITSWGDFEDELDPFAQRNWYDYDNQSPRQNSGGNQFSAGGAVTFAQDVVKAMLSGGYSLSKGTLSKAKAFDESHQVSATAAAKVAELSEKIGLTDKLFAGVEVVRSVDQTLHISGAARSAVSATGRTAAAAATTVMSSSYFSQGALWVSDALNRASKAAADLGNK
jgi:RNA recognition motif-containing protein